MSKHLVSIWLHNARPENKSMLTLFSLRSVFSSLTSSSTSRQWFVSGRTRIELWTSLSSRFIRPKVSGPCRRCKKILSRMSSTQKEKIQPWNDRKVFLKGYFWPFIFRPVQLLFSFDVQAAKDSNLFSRNLLSCTRVQNKRPRAYSETGFNEMLAC